MRVSLSLLVSRVFRLSARDLLGRASSRPERRSESNAAVEERVDYCRHNEQVAHPIDQPVSDWRGVDRAMLGAALLGAATGLRSQSGIAAVEVGKDTEGLPAMLAGPRARAVVTAGALGELVIDKLPKTGSRLEPEPLAARIVLGGLAGGQLARARCHPALPAAGLAALAALISAKVGHDTRMALAKRLGDPVAAVMEDTVTLGLAFVAIGCR
jgi:uncharacterized membrane protein